MVGRKTEKNRLKRSIGKVQETMRTIRHEPMKAQAAKINQILRGHYAYYGMTGNIRCLIKVYQAADNYWRRMLSIEARKVMFFLGEIRSIKGEVSTVATEDLYPV